jgi:predicted nucleic acid-binding protein
LIVVSDTSPLLNLARINKLEILGSLYHQVLIPHAVHQELTASGYDLVKSAPTPWLIVATPKDQDRVRALRGDLDPGEAEAIVLAIELHADLLLVDERRGRRIAASLGLQITGLLGVLADAKQAGLIDRIKPVLDELIRDARFWIGADLYARVLVEFGEN